MSSTETFRLTKNPIALVLCQIRFSGIMAMETTYLPDIQARLRGIGFKVNASNPVPQIQFMMTPQGPQPQATKHYEFQNLERTESVVICPDFVTYQATKYVCFPDFLARLMEVIDQVRAVTNGLTVERLGLRYIDAIVPRAGETWHRYVQPGLCGIASNAFKAQSEEQVHQIIAETAIGGTMIIRVLSNTKGIPMPPDMTATKLALSINGTVIPGLGAATIDVDHFCAMQPTEYDSAVVGQQLWDLKHIILDIWKNQIVSKEALEIWS
jgi:uncharacterized protein (TIGR04255 family)